MRVYGAGCVTPHPGPLPPGGIIYVTKQPSGATDSSDRPALTDGLEKLVGDVAHQVWAWESSSELSRDFAIRLLVLIADHPFRDALGKVRDRMGELQNL